MNIDEVEAKVHEVMTTVDTFPREFLENSAIVRNATIDPILWALGWQTWLPWECRPDYEIRAGRRVDYALFDESGQLAVVMLFQCPYRRREYGLAKLRRTVRGMTDGVAVLTCGPLWEIYDLSIGTRRFFDKRAEQFFLGPQSPDGPDEVASALYHWIARHQWRR